MLKVKPFLFILFLTVFVALFTTACSDTGSNSSGGIYDNSTTNPGGGTENPGGGDTENPGGGDTENPGGGDTENPGGGEEDKPGVTAIDLAGDPFTLLGVYDVTLYGIDEEPVTTPASKSELRVGLNLSTAEGGIEAPEVIMYLDFEGKKITFDKYIINLADLANYDNDLNKFIAATFSNLGAELIENSKYGLYFTLDPAKNPHYSPILDNFIIQNSQYLKLKLDKTKDLAQDGGLDLDEETPTDPEEPEVPEEPVTVPVESVAIKGQQTVVHGGASFQLTAEVLPNDATNKAVIWESNHPDYISVDNQGNVTIKGYTEETITITAISTADNTKTASWQFNIKKATVTDIIVKPAEMTLTLKNDGSPVSANIVAAVEPAIAAEYTTVNYYVTSGSNYVAVDENGLVMAIAEGNAVVTVSVGDISKEVNVTVEPAPVEEILVTDITVTTDKSKVYKKYTNVTIDFELTPYNTTDTIVTYKKLVNGEVVETNTISTNNGKGSLTLSNIQEDVTIVFSISNSNGTAEYLDSYPVIVVDGVDSISFENIKVTKEQNTVFTNNIVNKSSIENSIASWTYSSDDESIASVDPVTGQVTAKKNGVTTIRVTAQPKYDAEPLPAEFQIDVLGHIDYSSPEAFLESSVGTYEIYFFGTKPGHATDGTKTPDVTVTNNCSIYVELYGGKCEGDGGMFGVANKIELGSNFAGLATITEKNGGIDLITKTYMTASLVKSKSKNDQYQYTLYRTTSYTDPNNANTSVKDVRGRHLTEAFDFPNSTFKVEQYKAEQPLTIKIYSQLFGKQVNVGIIGDDWKTINPQTYMLATKVSSKPQVLDYNDVSQAPFNKVGGSPDKPTIINTDIPYY